MINEFIYHVRGEKENTNGSNILETKKGKDQDFHFTTAKDWALH
jgi:hypothetical protein